MGIPALSGGNLGFLLMTLIVESRMRLAREPGVGSGEQGTRKKRAGSRDCHKKSKNR
jgi:hypothetical protein